MDGVCHFPYGRSGTNWSCSLQVQFLRLIKRDRCSMTGHRLIRWSHSCIGVFAAIAYNDKDCGIVVFWMLIWSPSPQSSASAKAVAELMKMEELLCSKFLTMLWMFTWAKFAGQSWILGGTRNAFCLSEWLPALSSTFWCELSFPCRFKIIVTDLVRTITN